MPMKRALCGLVAALAWAGCSRNDAQPGLSPTAASTGQELVPEGQGAAAAEPVEPQEVTICHFPPGRKDKPHTITVDSAALLAHLAHGDSVGSCGPCLSSGVSCSTTVSCCSGFCDASGSCADAPAEC